MGEDGKFKENSQAVQAHLSICQDVIQRMASNSASCKASCITLVSAILVIVADKGKPQYLFIAYIPAVLFFALDTYYLALERMFRNTYNEFIQKLHLGDIAATDLFAVTPSGGMFKNLVAATASFAIWPFYLTLLWMIVVVKAIAK